MQTEYIGITIRNFMSVGNITQSINFSTPELFLVLGENLDMGGQDNRNGVGKTTLVNALSFALFGKPLVNVKLDNLINKSNLKNMLVTLTFKSNGIDYKIERGRKPAVFKLYKNGTESVDPTADGADAAQGESRHTQEEIERIIGMSHDMFKHILALNTYVEPFLSMRAADQRVIIEQLLGITILSEKAERLKEQIKDSKELIKAEELKISAKQDSNRLIERNIQTMVSKSESWETAQAARILELQTSISQLLDLDIAAEIEAHTTKQTISELNSEYKSLGRELRGYTNEQRTLAASIQGLQRSITSTDSGVCPTCNQSLDDSKHAEMHSTYAAQITELEQALSAVEAKIAETTALMESIDGMIPAEPRTQYATLTQAYNHKTELDTLGNKLSALLDSTNPYTEQIEMLRGSGLQEISFDTINDLTRIKEHQDFLLKMLTNKDSFIRKKIIDQNISFLNTRLSHYLAEVGLPHMVRFLSDLEVEITQYGKEFDFDNLSRGERTRLVLSLSWAFRDVFESLYGKINLMFIDELVDQGLDSAGADAVLRVLKGMVRGTGKTVFLISHKEEYITRIDNILRVVKENNFTSFEVGDSSLCSSH